jgi:dimethylhistidine N-methyltransferase
MEVTKQKDRRDDDLAEIVDGLRLSQKTLSPKFFYDDRGSQLFEDITALPEYYLTDAEVKIMHEYMHEIVEKIGPQASLIEFGNGSSVKTRFLLHNIQQLAAYVPVDISSDYLGQVAEELGAEFPHIEVLPVAADFTHPFQLPNPKIMPVRNIVYFPGSTIGNFSPDAAHELLKLMHHEAGEGGALLIGVDLQKDRNTIERAYNDNAGVTAEFNLNMLRRINREHGANFALDKFEHRAVYNDDRGRIEMYLVSKGSQTVELDGEEFTFDAGETILTEHSHKYTLEGFRDMAERAGFQVDTVWTDPDGLFSLQYCLRV